MMKRADIGLGVVIAGLHVLAFPGLATRFQRADLSVTVGTSDAVLVAADGTLPSDATLPADITARITRRIDGRPPAGGKKLGAGVHREDWEVTYRGGFTRRVGRTIYAGPLQDPAAPPCSAWLTLTQPLVDGLAALLQARIAEGLEGRFGFQKIDEIDMHFSEVRGGALVTFIDLRFKLGVVQVIVWIVPRLEAGELRLEAEAQAEVKVKNTFARTAIHLFRQQQRIDGYASEAAQSEVEKAVRPLEAMFAAPPPLPLGQGRWLKLGYCKGEQIRVTRRSQAAIPLAIEGYATPSGMHPIHLPSHAPPPPAPDAPVSLDLDLNGVNAVLHHVWASGYFDTLLAERRLDRWFNEQELVQDLLTIRVADLRLTMPPTLTRNRGANAARHPFTLSTEGGLVITDGAGGVMRTPARVFGRVDVGLRTVIDPGPPGGSLPTPPGRHLTADVALHDLALTCEPAPGKLTPCYATLVDEARHGAADLHEPLAAALAAWLEKLVIGRTFGGEGGAPHFTVASATLTTRPDGDSAWFRLALDGAISETD